MTNYHYYICKSSLRAHRKKGVTITVNTLVKSMDWDCSPPSWCIAPFQRTENLARSSVHKLHMVNIRKDPDGAMVEPVSRSESTEESQQG